jgi:uncharacterized membrane protein YbhN (UPF0104 family)
MQSAAQIWVIVAAILVPLLSLVLHPRIFYPIADRILIKLGKPPVQKRMKWKSLIEVLLWNILGLLVQGLAVWLVVHQLLELPIEKWWLVAGAYCLAWCAGFLAFWAPGGLGVREAVFIAAMSFGISNVPSLAQAANLDERRLFLAFLAVLLRIWATVGELMLTGLAYALDRRRPKHTPTVAKDTTPDEPPAAVAHGS